MSFLLRARPGPPALDVPWDGFTVTSVSSYGVVNAFISFSLSLTPPFGTLVQSNG